MTAMDTVLEYLDTVSDRADLPDLSDDQLLKDVDIVADWVNDILDLQIGPEELLEKVRDGVLLCRLTNALASSARLVGVACPPPPGVHRYHRGCVGGSIQARDNVCSFSLWCMLYDVPPVLILAPDDVVMGRNSQSIISLLLFLVRKTADFTPQTLSRKSSTSSSGSYCDRVLNRRNSSTLSRGKSLEHCFNEVMNIRRSSMLRTRSQSVDSDQGSLCSSSSSRSPVNNEAESLIRDLNLACRNISKTVVVANIEIPGYSAHDQLTIERSLEEDSQAIIRRKNRLFKRSNSVANTNLSKTDNQTGKRRFLLKSGPKKSDDLDISKERLSFEDAEYFLLSSEENVESKIKAVYKLIALRALEAISRRGVTRVIDTSVDMTSRITPSYTFTTHSAEGRREAFLTLKMFLVKKISNNDDIVFGDVHRIWNDCYEK